MRTETKVTLFFAIALTGAYGVWYLLNLYSGGPAPQWVTCVISLLVLCAVTGLLAARRARQSERWVRVFLTMLAVTAVAAYVVVGFTMVGGVGFYGAGFAWNFGFWRVTTVGWFYAYSWFFGAFILLGALRTPRI